MQEVVVLIDCGDAGTCGFNGLWRCWNLWFYQTVVMQDLVVSLDYLSQDLGVSLDYLSQDLMASLDHRVFWFLLDYGVAGYCGFIELFRRRILEFYWTVVQQIESCGRSFIGLSCSRQNLAVGVLLDCRVVDIIRRQEFYWTVVQQIESCGRSFIGLSCSRYNLAAGVLFDYRLVDRILRFHWTMTSQDIVVSMDYRLVGSSGFTGL